MALQQRILAPLILLVFGLLALALPAAANQDVAGKHLQRAQALLQKNLLAEAQMELQQAINAAPGWDRPYADQARFFVHVKNTPGALQSWQAAIQRAPKNAGYHKELALVLESEARFEEAAASWQAMARLRPKDVEPLARQAVIYLERGNMDRAQGLLADARKVSPKDPVVPVLEARFAIARKDYKAAVALLEQALPALEGDAEASGQAQALLDQAQQEVASQQLRIALMVGVPLLILGAGAVTYRLLRRVEIKPPPTRLDNSSNATICRYVLDFVVSITGLPRALCWVTSLDGRRMELQATELMRASDLLARRDLNMQSLENWLKVRGGKPFLFKEECRELRFLDAFPRLVKDLEGVEMNAGVPLIWKGQFRGLLLLGRSRSAGGGDPEQRFQKNIDRVQDVAEQGAQALEQLRQNNLRIFDVETGTFNKAWFDVNLAEAVQSSRTTRVPLSLLILRMDAFDSIQERHGEKVASEVVVQLVEALEKCLRDENKTSLARLEGGVFAVLAPERGLREAPSLAQHLKAAVDSLKIPRNLPLPTGCVAFAVFPDHADDVNAFRRVAMRAFRDAVYLEGNRVLEAEPGGAFDPNEDLEIGFRTSGRKALTGESEEPAAQAPAEASAYQPFSGGARKAEAGPEAQDGVEGGIAPLRSSYPDSIPAPATAREESPARRQPLRTISRPPALSGPGPAGGTSGLRERSTLRMSDSEASARPAETPVPDGASDTSELADLGIDPLTQFCLQSTFEDLAEFEVRSGLDSGQPSSVLYIRLVNLTDLKAKGREEYLRGRKDLTALLQAFLRDEVDVPGLMGEDDFVLLLTGMDLASASSVASQVAMTVRNLKVGGRSASAAVGVACSHPGQVDGPTLIQQARTAASRGPGVHRQGSDS